ncbi:hypothetical protein DFH09DRAFT_1282794 [Mycena vulgaris]|nr:hypothetical protein DFH09DRAFT_1282794 [Mycena vulgaris]
MIATTTATLPPTTHSVPKSQRVRLMRSTRKLSAVLGITPFLVDPREPARVSLLEPAPERPTTITSVLSVDSSLPAERERDPAALVPAATPASTRRPTLLLRINTIPPRGRPRAASQAWGRPASSAGLSPASPDGSSAVGPLDEVLAARRKKVARLARTLGESVPLELVFPTPRPTLASATEGEKRDVARSSLEKLPLDVLQVTAPPSAFPLPRTSDVSSISSGRPSTASSERAWFPYTMRRTSNAQAPTPAPRRASVAGHQAERSGWRARGMKRTEMNWEGEWNQEPRAVVKALRELK